MVVFELLFLFFDSVEEYDFVGDCGFFFRLLFKFGELVGWVRYDVIDFLGIFLEVIVVCFKLVGGIVMGGEVWFVVMIIDDCCI